MEGLQADEVNLGEAKEASDDFRVDSNYFHSNELLKKLDSLSAIPLAQICEWITQGPNPVFMDEGEVGIPCLTGRNIRGNTITTEGADIVSEREFSQFNRFHLRRGDILVTLKGAGSTGKMALVEDSGPMMFSRNVGLIRLRADKLDVAEYVYAYFSSRHGQELIDRGVTGGTGQLTLPTGYLKRVPIPQFQKLAKRIGEIIAESKRRTGDSIDCIAQAEQTLLRALGLEGWEPPEPLTYTRRASEALTAARFDAEYFAPRVAQLLAQLSADGLTIHDVAPARHEAFDPKAPKARPIPAQGNALGHAPRDDKALKGRPMHTADWHAPTGLNECGDTVPGALPQAGMERAVGPETNVDQSVESSDDTPTGTFHYIEISGLRSDGTATSEIVPLDEAPSRANQKVHKGDIITSTVRPIRRLTAIIGPDQHEHVCSSGFVVLNPTAIAPEVLLTYLRLPIVCELMDLHTSASLYPAISERDILKLPIPKIPDKAAKEIITQIRQAHQSRHEAQALLVKAKRAVEVAIEKGEEKALLLLQP